MSRPRCGRVAFALGIQDKLHHVMDSGWLLRATTLNRQFHADVFAGDRGLGLGDVLGEWGRLSYPGLLAGRDWTLVGCSDHLDLHVLPLHRFVFGLLHCDVRFHTRPYGLSRVCFYATGFDLVFPREKHDERWFRFSRHSVLCSGIF